MRVSDLHSTTTLHLATETYHKYLRELEIGLAHGDMQRSVARFRQNCVDWSFPSAQKLRELDA